MKYAVDHDYHIHSLLSQCSNDPEQNVGRILRYGEENGFKKICLTNHLWDEAVNGCYGDITRKTYKYLSSELPLPQGEKTQFFFGCETDMDKNLVLGISREVADKLDFVIVSTTHLHLTGYTIEEGVSLSERGEFYIKRVEKMLASDLDFKKTGIAHPVSGHASPENPFNELFEKIGEENTRRVFKLYAESGAGVEINAKDFDFSRKSAEHAAAIVRFYGVLKECGCKFYLGSDAHHPNALDAAPRLFENAVNELGLIEEDKFSF